MDVLFVVGQGSKHENQELRWALRSFEKHASNVGRVIVAGYPPEWLAGGVERFPVEQPWKRGAKNVLHTIDRVMREAPAGWECLLAQDDVFFTRDVDLDRYPVYIKGEDLPTSVPEHDKEHSGWWTLLIETREFLRKHGLPSVNFAQHCDIHIGRDETIEAAAVYREIFNRNRGVDSWGFLGNLWYARHPEAALVPRKDVKVRMTTTQELTDLEATHDAISIGDQAFDSRNFMRYMADRFGAKSRWEV